MILPLRRYADFRSRATRAEFWLFAVFLLIAFTVTVWLDVALATGGTRVSEVETGPGLWAATSAVSGGWITGLFGLAMLVPLVAVAVRRLHDCGRTGLWLMLVVVPLAGPLVLLVFLLTDGQRRANRYGPDAKAVSKQAVAPPPSLG